MRSSDSADYFVAWIDRLIETARAHSGYNTEAEKSAVLKSLTDARAIYSERAAR